MGMSSPWRSKADLLQAQRLGSVGGDHQDIGRGHHPLEAGSGLLGEGLVAHPDHLVHDQDFGVEMAKARRARNAGPIGAQRQVEVFAERASL